MKRSVMCGIAGYWDFSQAHYDHESVLNTFHEAIANRGPDSFDIWSDKPQNFYLSHRRLAIRDLTAHGAQPMQSKCGRYIIAYNGEIYNAEELKKEINDHRTSPTNWIGHSDTEVIIEGFATFGVADFTKKMIGMFAIAFYDREEKQLHLVRDRMGIKPLYYGFSKNCFFFGSQPKSFYKHPLFEKKINKKVLANFFKINFIPNSASIFYGFQQLKPGTIVTLTNTKKLKVNEYWRLRDQISPRERIINPQEAVERLEPLINDAVKRRMVSDVPIGAFLSGGVDSSLVASLMQKNSENTIKTFTIGFHEDGYNEAIYAKEVAKHLGTDHYEEYLPLKKTLDIIPSIPEYCDEPFADSSQIPTLLVSQIARKNVTVALSGDGGDELFCGYRRYFEILRARNILDKIPKPLRKLGYQVGKILPDQLFGMLGPKSAFRYQKAFSVLQHDDIAPLFETVFDLWFDQELVDGEQSDFQILSEDFTKAQTLDDQTYMQLNDALRYLPDDILTKVDRASMHVSLEARVPLLDHRIVEMSYQIAPEIQYRDQISKWPLREILYKHVPKELIERPKMGFGIPIDVWLREDLKDWAFDLLTKASNSGILNNKAIWRAWDLHQKKDMNTHFPLWGILMWQQWREHYDV